MRKLLQRILRKPVSWLAAKLSSSPQRSQVFDSLDLLYRSIQQEKSGYTKPIPFDMNEARFVLLSDQHKGGKDAADDFRHTENNYLTALRHYFDEGFTYVNLGDCEELWESTPAVVIEKNKASLLEEARFLAAERYYRIFGNHDLEWKYAFPQALYLRPVFGNKLEVPEGYLLTTEYNGRTFSFFLAHGHQGDQRSDGNAFSMWFVAAIWTPIQRYLEISVDVISDSFDLVDKHNIMMYDWSATKQNLIFISGHTHKPVFASLDHIDRLNKKLDAARSANDPKEITAIEQELEKRKHEYAGKKFVKTMARPSYFNTGCCCFSDGDLTGIEIDRGVIRLVKWEAEGEKGRRIVLEESSLAYVFDQF